MLTQLLNQHWSYLAMAYIDSGTGSILLQAMLAGVLGGLYVVKTRFAQLRAIIGRLKNQKGSGD